jgi:hypothetical protein
MELAVHIRVRESGQELWRSFLARRRRILLKDAFLCPASLDTLFNGPESVSLDGLEDSRCAQGRKTATR